MGNTVVLKLASAIPVVAVKFVEVLEEACIPANVVNFVPGSDAEVGGYPIDHPNMNLVTFTGLRDVGIRIWERARKVYPIQKHLKQVIIELGGKTPLWRIMIQTLISLLEK